MPLDWEFLKKLMSREPKDVYARNWEKYEAAKVEEKSIIKQEEELSKQESAIDKLEKSLVSSIGIGLTEYLRRPEDSEELEIRRQVQNVLAEKKKLASRKNELLERKIQLETQIQQLETLMRELKMKEAEVQEQTERINSIKSQIALEEKDIRKTEEYITPKRKIEIRIETAGKRAIYIALVLMLFFIGVLGIFSLWIVTTYSELFETRQVLENEIRQNHLLAQQLEESEKEAKRYQAEVQTYKDEATVAKEQVQFISGQYTDLKGMANDLSNDLNVTRAERNRYAAQADKFSKESLQWQNKYTETNNALTTANGRLTKIRGNLVELDYSFEPMGEEMTSLKDGLVDVDSLADDIRDNRYNPPLVYMEATSQKDTVDSMQSMVTAMQGYINRMSILVDAVKGA